MENSPLTTIIPGLNLEISDKVSNFLSICMWRTSILYILANVPVLLHLFQWKYRSKFGSLILLITSKKLCSMYAEIFINIDY